MFPLSSFLSPGAAESGNGERSCGARAFWIGLFCLVVFYNSIIYFYTLINKIINPHLEYFYSILSLLNRRRGGAAEEVESEEPTITVGKLHCRVS